MKKAFTLFMCVVMCLCMAVTTFAVDISTITGIGYNTVRFLYNNDTNEYEKKENFEDYIQSHGGYAYLLNINGWPTMIYASSKLEVHDGKSFLKSSSQYDTYSWDNSRQGWRYSETKSYDSANGLGNLSTNTLWWASADVMEGSSVYMSGDPNFREPPLATVVLKLTEEELVEVAVPEMVGAMKVLVPCGVGLMALLMGLSLFGKRSLIFLR